VLSYHVPRCPGKVSFQLFERLVDIGIHIVTVWEFLVHNILVYSLLFTAAKIRKNYEKKNKKEKNPAESNESAGFL
jgi:hypothetical protein